MLRPKSITIQREDEILEIVWADGHESRYPLSGIRNVCPCASCQGGHENMGGPPDRAGLRVMPLATWELSTAEMVGNYAIRFVWADGHDGGIYTWDYLRALCPCEACQIEHGERPSSEEGQG
ncbi:MAG: hypothetical protein Kow0047_20380 [Anaerolineae bacterium]